MKKWFVYILAEREPGRARLLHSNKNSAVYNEKLTILLVLEFFSYDGRKITETSAEQRDQGKLVYLSFQMYSQHMLRHF